MNRDSDARAQPVYWCRQNIPNPLRGRLFKAYSDFQRDTGEINRNLGLSRVFTKNLPTGGTITGRRPDLEARFSRFCQLCDLLLREATQAWADHLIGYVGLCGDKAVKAFKDRADELIREAFESCWRVGYAGGTRDEVFWRMAKEIMESKTEELRAIWPPRGRPAKAPTKDATGALAVEINRLLREQWRGKKTRLTAELGVDLHTLNKILRDGHITDTTRQKILDGLQRLSHT
jgi:hypothetical protein